MNIDYLIQLLGNRLKGLDLAKDQAFQAGDLERLNVVGAEILDVQNTLSKLKLIASIEQTASATSFTEAEVVKNGIEASFNPTIINDATKSLLEYDITPYATDPGHELKIQAILEEMGPMMSNEEVETYVKNSSPNSPLTGVMIVDAASKYAVDVRLVMALMELDSRFGTLGVGARTFNPGNVGNTGTQEVTYGSWGEGVEAVAQWLNNHRKDTVKKVEVIDAVESVSTVKKETPSLVVPTTVETATSSPAVNNQASSTPSTVESATTSPATTIDTSTASTTPTTVETATSSPAVNNQASSTPSTVESATTSPATTIDTSTASTTPTTVETATSSLATDIGTTTASTSPSN
jgi:hypothetical protein